MKIYTGTDIVEVSRIKKAIEKSGENFLDIVFTKKEQEYCNSKKSHLYESYAARFAAKEAVSKALGTGIGKDVGFLEIEVQNDEKGKPFVLLLNKTLDLSKRLNIVSQDISISHTSDYAVAFVVMVADNM